MATNLGGLVKRLQDIMRNDPGINGDAQRIEQIIWSLFLKVYDAKEEDWEMDEDDYQSIIPESYRWRNWAHDDGSGTARIILSGIHQYYEPEQLIGKTAIAILNLPPRKMMGIPSCGMLISAVHKEKGEEKLHLMLIDDAIPAGAKLC